jgi:aminopeptidase N
LTLNPRLKNEKGKSFPCFDEPNMKAIFKIIVQHDVSLNVLSNMPVKTSSLM